MRGQRYLVAATVATLLGMGAPEANATNLLVNGSFESWSGGTTSANQPDRIFNNLSLVVPGWNFNIGLSSDIYRDLNASGAIANHYRAADGDYLAASGSFQTLHEAVSQTFVVTAGAQYKLTFQMAPGGLHYSGNWIEHATVGSSWLVTLTGAVASAVSQSFPTDLAHFDGSGTTNPLQWTTESLVFTADNTGGNVTLQFTAYGDMTHIFLDDVSVEVYDTVSIEESTWGAVKRLFD